MAKAYKKDFGYSYCFGVYPTLELLKHRPAAEILNIFLSPTGMDNRGVEEIKKQAKEKEIQIEQNAGMLENLSGSNNTYAMAVFKKFESPINPGQNHVVLVNPSDMGNLGTIMRTMLGFNIVNLAIIKPAVDHFDPKVIRASMGAIFQMNFQLFDNFESYKESTKNHLYPFLTNGGEVLDKISFDSPFSLIFGSESSGLPEKFNGVGTTVRIPQSDKIDSLALPISVGIALNKTFN